MVVIVGVKRSITQLLLPYLERHAVSIGVISERIELINFGGVSKTRLKEKDCECILHYFFVLFYFNLTNCYFVQLSDLTAALVQNLTAALIYNS